MNQTGGSCKISAIRAQIERTLMPFPGVESVVISVEGDVAGALQP
jgi:spore germination protein GerM